VQFWSNLLHAKYDKVTRKLALADGTQWLGGCGFDTSSLYVREDYERLWSKIPWGMSFSDDAVEGLYRYVPNDADKQDLTWNEGSLRGYIVNGTPGGFCWRVLLLRQNVITGCQVCLDTDGILYTNTSPPNRTQGSNQQLCSW